MHDNSRLPELQAKYTEALCSYVTTHNENALFNISKLSREFIGEGLGPDDITTMHSVAMGKIVNELGGNAAVEAFHISTEPLLEIMMNYAIAYHGNMEQYRKRLAEYESGESAKELEKLASVGLLLLGTVSQMINQMESIANYAEMMVQGGISRAKELSQVLMQEADDCREMLKSAFLYSRSVSKRADEKTPMNMNELLMESIEVIRNATALDSVAIQADHKNVVKVNVNPAEMKQALVNVLTSTIDTFQGSGSLITSISTQKNAGRENVVLRIFATNNGTAKRTDIFSLPMAKTTVGLNIARSIIKRQGGLIDINGNDRGTAIIITLPVAIKMNDFIKRVSLSQSQSVG